METATSAILTHWHIPPALLPCFLGHADGLAALALLCNAGAKHDGALYQFKAMLVEAACRAAGAHTSWVDIHTYPRAARWRWLTRINSALWQRTRLSPFAPLERMTIYFIETTLQLDGQPLQLVFHFPPGAALPDLPGWPPPFGRRWRGQRVQARALEVALAYLAEC